MRAVFSFHLYSKEETGMFDERGNSVTRPFTMLLVLALLFFCRLASAAQPPIAHTVPELLWPDTVEMTIKTDLVVRSVRVYFLRPGFSEYQLRFMKSMGEGVFSYQLDTSTFDSPTLQYYFEVRAEEGIFLYPDDAPATPLLVEGERDGLDLEFDEVPAALLNDWMDFGTGSVTLNGSVEYRVVKDSNTSEESETSDEDDSTDEDDSSSSRFGDRDLLADFNLRLARTWEKGKTTVSLDTNMTYSNNPLEDTKEVGISSFLLEVDHQAHRLMIGDQEVTGSSLLGESMSTRGMGYYYSHGRVTAEVYGLNSRETTVVEDSLPASDHYVTGARLGVDLVEDLFHIDLHYLSGRDDSSIATNSSGSENVVMDGSAFLVAPKVFLFDKLVTLYGEYGESSSSKEILADEDETDSTDDDWVDEETETDTTTDTGWDNRTDSAWRTGGIIEKGAWKFSGSYKYIGASYQSVMNLDELSFAADRQGVDLGLEYTTDILDVVVSWEDVTDNLDDDADKDWSKYQTFSITPTWRVTDNLSLSVGHTNDQERSYEDRDRTERLSDQDTIGYSMGVDYSFSDTNTVQLSWSRDETEVQESPESDSRTDTITCNYSFYTDQFQIYPAISYSWTEMEEELTETLNVSISGDYAILPEILSLSTDDSITCTTSDQSDRTQLLSLAASLNLRLGWAHNSLGDTVLSLVAEYEEDDQGDTCTEEYSVSTKLDFMF